MTSKCIAVSLLYNLVKLSDFIYLHCTFIYSCMLSALAGDDQIRSTLSELDGVNKELEYALRTRGCALIKRAGILSDL